MIIKGHELERYSNALRFESKDMCDWASEPGLARYFDKRVMDDIADAIKFLQEAQAHIGVETNVVDIRDHLAAVPRHGSVTVTRAPEIGEAS